jgi:hypothetical protein
MMEAEEGPMGIDHGWVYFIFPAPVLYISSVVLAGTLLWRILKNQKSRKPSLLAAWMGATLAALVPQVLAAIVMFLQADETSFLFPGLAIVPGAALVLVCLRRIFDVRPLRAVLLYGICLFFQAVATVPLYLAYRRSFMPAFFIFCVMLLVSLPIFMAFRSFRIPELGAEASEP